MSKYAGIGSRSAPEAALRLAVHTARYLAKEGWVLRSGAAKGMDSAFEAGCEECEIFTPRSSGVDWEGAMKLASQLHPNWNGLSHYVQLLMARNCFQLLGSNLDDPVSVVLCWTPDGAETTTSRETGGTGQAIRLAVQEGIPVLNMKNYSTKEWVELVRSLR